MIPSLRLWTSASKDKYTEDGMTDSDIKYKIESIFNRKIIYYPIRIHVGTSLKIQPLLKENT